MQTNFPQQDPQDDTDMISRRRAFWAAVGVSSAVIFGFWIWLLPSSLGSRGISLNISEMRASVRDSEIVKRADGLKDGLSEIAQNARAAITSSGAATEDKILTPIEKLKARIGEESQKNSIEAQQP